MKGDATIGETKPRLFDDLDEFGLVSVEPYLDEGGGEASGDIPQKGNNGLDRGIGKGEEIKDLVDGLRALEGFLRESVLLDGEQNAGGVVFAVSETEEFPSGYLVFPSGDHVGSQGVAGEGFVPKQGDGAVEQGDKGFDLLRIKGANIGGEGEAFVVVKTKDVPYQSWEKTLGGVYLEGGDVVEVGADGHQVSADVSEMLEGTGDEGFANALPLMFWPDHEEENIADAFARVLGDGGEGMKGDKTEDMLVAGYIRDGGGGEKHFPSEGGFETLRDLLQSVIKLEGRGGEPSTHLDENRDLVWLGETYLHPISTCVFS